MLKMKIKSENPIPLLGNDIESFRYDEKQTKVEKKCCFSFAYIFLVSDEIPNRFSFSSRTKYIFECSDEYVSGNSKYEMM